MPKTIALHSSTGALAKYLTDCGYRVVDYDSLSRPGVSVDAVLSTGYHPDMTSHSSFTERVDISLGNIHHAFNGEKLGPVNINITGMGPDQVKSALGRLEHHHHSRN